MNRAEKTAGLTRRQVLHKALLAVPVLISFSPLLAMAGESPIRKLSFFHTHTKERLSVVYSRKGKYLPEAFDRINHFLGDFRTGEIHAIDPALMDNLYDIQAAGGNKDGIFEVISGFRSLSTNTKLRGKSNGVAKRSLHMCGRAIDVRLAGTDISKLRDISIALRRGGTGYYPQSDFIHVDTGRVRCW